MAYQNAFGSFASGMAEGMGLGMKYKQMATDNGGNAAPNGQQMPQAQQATQQSPAPQAQPAPVQQPVQQPLAPVGQQPQAGVGLPANYTQQQAQPQQPAQQGGSWNFLSSLFSGSK